jgi:tetratricopeptide (TPR) repeat protein
MEREKVLEMAHSLISIDSDDSTEIENAEKILLDYLSNNDEDTEMWYHLAILVLIPPLVDDESAIKYLDRVWHNTKDIKAVIYTAVIQDIHCVISDDIFNILQNHKTNDNLISSMCFYCMGLYYNCNEDYNNAKLCFLKAVQLCSYFVHSYYKLGYLYKNENLALSKYYYCCAVKNVAISNYGDNEGENDNWLSIDDFEKETILGVFATTPKYQYLRDLELGLVGS